MSSHPTMLGTYRLLSQLGEGGMGVVYLARDQGGREVALKILNEARDHTEETLKRFMREARISLEMKHPHVVHTYDAGVCDGVMYIASEYLARGSLAARLEKDGALGETEALEVLRAIVAALVAFEEANIVHRDVKPENVLFDGQGVPKLADLGLARSTADQRVRYTRTGQIMGSPLYMSPEQIDGLTSLDIRTDLYSSGAVLYECLSGRPPYEGKSNYSIIKQHLSAPIPEVREAAPDASEDVAALVRDLLQKDRNARPATAAEVHERIAAMLARRKPGASSTDAALRVPSAAEMADVPETIRLPVPDGEGALTSAALHFEGPAGPRIVFVYGGTRLRLGREVQSLASDACTVVRPAAASDKANQRISRKHCELVFSAEGPALVDLGGRGGTRLGDRTLEPNRPEPLPPLALVSLAQVLGLRFRVLAPPACEPLAGHANSREPAVFIERPANGADHAYLLVPGRVSLAAPAGSGIVPGLVGDSELCWSGGKLWLRSGGYAGKLAVPVTDGLEFLVEGTKVTVRPIRLSDQT